MTGRGAAGGAGADAASLAILGGRPRFAEPLHVGRPNVGDRARLMERIGAVLDSRRLTNDGPLVQELERAVARFVGVRNCVATCSGTLALQLAIRAAGVHTEAIVSPLTFVATAHALQWQGIRPRFCDVDPRTHNLDPERVEAMLTPRTSAIVGVHLWGRPCAVEELADVADRHGLTLLFDAAHGFGCSHHGRMIGRFGRAEALSFHATKFVSSFEGGAITTDDDALAERARLMRNHGFAGYDEVCALGTNAKMSEPSAAMGLTSLEARDEFYAANRRNFEAYRAGLEGTPGVALIDYDGAEACTRHYVVVELDESAGLSRDELQQVLWADNVLARRYFFPGCHRLEPYRTMNPDAWRELPHAERLAGRLLVLPTGTAVDPEAIATVTALVRTALAAGPLRPRLAAAAAARVDRRRGGGAPGP